MKAPWRVALSFVWIFVGSSGTACGAPPGPQPPASAEPRAREAKLTAPARRSAAAPDDCEPRPGEQPPEPLRAAYSGVARAARCQREVYTIMGGVTHFLGVPCKHCHLEPDYAADTHNKQVANWMARELVPRLRRRLADGGGQREVWCQDCHAGKPRLLGNPRRRDLAIDWMTRHLVENFETPSGKPPRCRQCHGGELGSPEFRAKIILEGPSLEPAPSPGPSAPSSAPSVVPSSSER